MTTLKEDLSRYELGFVENIRDLKDGIIDEFASCGKDVEKLIAVYSHRARDKMPSSVNILGEKMWNLVSEIVGMDKLVREADSVLEENYSVWAGTKKQAEMETKHANSLYKLEYVDTKNAMLAITFVNEFLGEVGTLDSNDEFGMKGFFDSSSQKLKGLYEKVYRLMGAVHTTRAVLHYSEPIEGLAVGPITGWK